MDVIEDYYIKEFSGELDRTLEGRDKEDKYYVETNEITKYIETRFLFAEFYATLLTEDVILKINEIKTLVDHIENSITFEYGGRMWNKHIRQNINKNTATLNRFEYCSTLAGNYDIVSIIPVKTQTDNLYNEVFKTYIEAIKQLTELFEKNVNNSVYNDLLQVELNYDNKSMFKTISYGRGFRISLVPKKFQTKSQIQKLELIDKKVYQNAQLISDKLLFYLELGMNIENNICIYPEYAYKYMVDKQTKQLTIIGIVMLVFTMSYSGSKNREQEKGLPVDDIRIDLMKKYLIPLISDNISLKMTGGITKRGGDKYRNPLNKSYKATYNSKYQPDYKIKTFMKNTKKPQNYKNYPMYTVLYIILVLFPETFNIDFMYYKNIQGNIIDKFVNIYYSNQKNDIDNFTTNILDKYNGLTIEEDNYPSLRQILIMCITHLYNILYDNNNYDIFLSGGEALRAYLPEINYTTDIDAKFMYKKGYKIPLLFSTIIATFIVVYLKEHNYFKINETLYKLDILLPNNKNITITRNINTKNQQIIPNLRVYTDFIIPLISIDLKINGFFNLPDIYFNPTIYHKNGYTVPNNNIKTSLVLSPLDIALCKANGNKIFEKKETCKNYLQYNKIPNCSNSVNNNPSIPMTIKNNNKLFCLPSYPTSTFLYDDIYKMIETKSRQQKIQKDISRITMLDNIKMNGNFPEYPNLERIYTIQNIKCNNEKNLMIHYRDFEKRVVNIMLEINNYVSNKNIPDIIDKTNISNLIVKLSNFVEIDKQLFINILGSINFSSNLIHYKSPHSFENIQNKLNDIEGTGGPI
jgi:hypothetical protein